MVETGDIRIDKIMPQLFESWATLLFEECLENKSAKFKKLKKKEIESKGKYPVIDQGERFIAGYVNDESDVYVGTLPIIIFGDHTRRIKYIDFEFAVGADGTKLLHPFEYLHPKFFYYYLNALNLESQGYSRHYRFLKQIAVPIPPLNEQHRIVVKLEKLLQKVDACKERLDKIPTILKRFRQSILAAACSGRLTADWREEHPQAKPVETKGEAAASANDLMEIPETWRWVNLPKTGEMRRGKSRHRPRNAPFLFGGSYPFIQTGDIAQSGGRITSHKQTYSESGLAQSRLWPARTVCITIAANIAESALLIYPACFPDSVVGIIADETISLPKFLEFFIRTAKTDLSTFAPATAQKNINIKILSDVLIPLPPLEEQQEIVRRVEALFKIADQLEERYSKARAYVDKLTQSILSKAFRGELVPQDPNDESASELLKRIKEGKDRQTKRQEEKVKK